MSTATRSRQSAPDLWAGMECTTNRVGDEFRDQLSVGGHYSRSGDLERLAALNIKRLRYPVLWEHYQPVEGQAINWSRAKRDTEFLQSKEITPIVGLLHHGSGPRHTNLLDPSFPDKFRSYSHAVAKALPDIAFYTPINEPLTTARFSAMYGHWYPHHRSPYSFLKALLHQVKGIVYAMQAIREVNPDANLVQTEDLAKTHSTPVLQYQANFENERRWLTFDLLCGKVGTMHPLWHYLIQSGITEDELAFFSENTCIPDVAGLNYYVTSERFLDENVAAYPSLTPGGNGRHIYIDTEAVRVSSSEGLKTLLAEAWERFQIPIAITEAHLACTREEQMRWLKEVWDTATEANESGIPVKAVTAWTTFGAYDWDSLLTVNAGHYEPGAFDVRNGVRPTALAAMMKSLGSVADFKHPLLLRHGWWHPKAVGESQQHIQKNEPPLLLIGKGGTLATAFQKICTFRNIGHVALSRIDCDITRDDDIRRAIDQYKPWAVVNTAGYVDVDRAETDTAACNKLNVTGPTRIAAICREKGIKYMTFSSDLVFSGLKSRPYDEFDAPAPVNHYGFSKAQAEASVLGIDPSVLIIRTSAFFGPWDKANFAFKVLQALRGNEYCPVVSDVTVSPTYVPHLVNAALDLFIDDASGIWHVCNEGQASWAEFASELADRKDLPRKNLIQTPIADLHWHAPRPKFSALCTAKGINMPSLDHAITEYITSTNF